MVLTSLERQQLSKRSTNNGGHTNRARGNVKTERLIKKKVNGGETHTKKTPRCFKRKRKNNRTRVWHERTWQLGKGENYAEECLGVLRGGTIAERGRFTP